MIAERRRTGIKPAEAFCFAHKEAESRLFVRILCRILHIIQIKIPCSL